MEGGPSASAGFQGALHLLYNVLCSLELQTTLKHTMIIIHRNTKVISNLVEKRKRDEKKRKPYFSFALKIPREDACLVSSGRQFHDLTPL